MTMAFVDARIRTFRDLHASGCFVMPNPWDPGSARLFEQLGFRALATTSAGFAWSMGLADNHVPLSAVLAHLRTMADATTLPVNADFERGFATDPDDVAANVTAACATGIAGMSIEDATGVASHPLMDFALAVDRIRAARRAIDGTGTGVLLTARSEGFVAGRPDIAETTRRLVAFAAAGADCVYAPGVSAIADVAAIVRAVAPTPVNVLAGAGSNVGDLAAAGVRRISVGGAIARVAWKAVLDAAREIASEGTFTRLAHAIPGPELNEAFGRPPRTSPDRV